MIIALSGRLQSGKSELAKVCLDNGFVTLKFADALKDLICELLNIDRKFLENNKEVRNSYTISYTSLSKYLCIDKDDIINIRESRIFKSIRELLQFIGTDIIRKFNPSWHVDKLRENIKDNTNYCIDDLRFKNEKELVDMLGGECWYLLRTANFNILNHSSDVSLNWSDFGNKIIINDTNIKSLKGKFNRYVQCKTLLNRPILGYKTKHSLRDYLYTSIVIYKKSTRSLAKNHNCSRDKIVWWCNHLLVPLKKHKYYFNTKSFLHADEIGSYYAGLLTADGCIKEVGKYKSRCVVELSSIDKELVYGFKNFLCTDKPVFTKKEKGNRKKSYQLVCENSFIIQNLKHWGIKPRKTMKECIPDIIRHNKDNMKAWVVGLIDGDGSVCISHKNLKLNILASEEVIDFIFDFIPIKSVKRQHKGLDLYELNWHNFNAVAVRDWLSPKTYLSRKWAKFDLFLSFNTERRTEPFIG